MTYPATAAAHSRLHDYYYVLTENFYSDQSPTHVHIMSGLEKALFNLKVNGIFAHSLPISLRTN